MCRCRLLLAIMVAIATPLAFAQPDPHQRVGQTLADAMPAGYRIERLPITSADGEHRYRVHLIVPTAAPPMEGYPVAYLLDGNAALMELDATLLQQLVADGNPPVLALIAHDNDLRIDGAARTFDYTPRRSSGVDDEFDATNPARRSGGADAFLELIETRIKPAVAAKVKVDRQQQMLWGHSYGGLFVLHALAARPEAFSTYVAVDPSLWWGNGFIVDEIETSAAAHPTVSARLMLMRGTPAAGADPVRHGPHMARVAGNAGAGKRLEQALQRMQGLKVESRVLPGLSHGQTLGASIAPALRALID